MNQKNDGGRAKKKNKKNVQREKSHLGGKRNRKPAHKG